VVAKPVVSIAFAVRYAGALVDSVVFGSTTLTLAERLIALLPDAAETSSDEDEDELLSSFAQPRRIRLIAKSIIARKLNVLLIMTPYLMNKF